MRMLLVLVVALVFGIFVASKSRTYPQAIAKKAVNAIDHHAIDGNTKLIVAMIGSDAIAITDKLFGGHQSQANIISSRNH